MISNTKLIDLKCDIIEARGPMKSENREVYIKPMERE